jgi:hypothetical protein
MYCLEYLILAKKGSLIVKIYQLSLFIENKPGTLNDVCQVLNRNKLNIRTLSLADTEQFGILRLLLKEWERAKVVLEEAGFLVKVTEVVALKVEDRPGGLAEILNMLNNAKVNIEYMYAFTFGMKNSAIIVFRFEDLEKALKTLEHGKVDTITAVDLFKDS